MGKKTKQGKSRKDKFYFLAKETGYRSRAAFKLIQLNRRFNFLGSSKTLIDLCAAPGGWMQVAAKEMPVNSLIVGVDLMPILPIANCKSIIGDITTDKCRQLLRAALLNNKADVVLHDGAPNVGTAWTIDEYTQAALCLKAFALATEFLRRGGWFITKVFRSRDYEPLKWAISQFFRKVRALKPEASRQESAEIFLIGQSYLQPSHIDPKFLDHRHVFCEIEIEKSRESVVSSLLRHSTKRKKAEGYDDKLYHETPLSVFMEISDPLQCLATTNKIVCDREDLMQNPLTPSFLKSSFSDIRVLGKSEIRAILSWRKKILASLEAAKKDIVPIAETGNAIETTAPDSAEEEEETQREVERLLKDEQMVTKKRLKNIRKAKRKLAERVVLKMEHPGDHIEQNDGNELFSLASVGDLDSFEKAEADLKKSTGHSGVDLLAIREENIIRKSMKAKQTNDYRRAVEGGEFLQFDRNSSHDADLGALESTRPLNAHERDDLYLSSSDDESEPTSDHQNEMTSLNANRNVSDYEMDDDDYIDPVGSDDEDFDVLLQDSVKNDPNSLLVDLDPASEETKNKRKMDSWCNSTEVKNLMDIENSDSEELSDSEPSKSKSIVPSDKVIKNQKRVSFAGPKETVEDSKPYVTDVDASAPVKLKKTPKKLRRPLTAVEKALAVRLIQSTKSRRDLVEWNFHRYRFFEEPSSLPDWFVEDETKHMRKPLPLKPEELQPNRPVVGKTLKKAEEAKARKKMRTMKRLNRVRRRAENLPDDLGEKESWNKIKTMYKNAGLLSKKRRPVHHVVNTKAGSRNKDPPPRGAKIKLVDKRMKSDRRGMSKQFRKSSSGRGGKGKTNKSSASRGRNSSNSAKDKHRR